LKQIGSEAETFVCNVELMFMLLIKSAVKVCSKGLRDPQQRPRKHITIWGTGNPHVSEQ